MASTVTFFSTGSIGALPGGGETASAFSPETVAVPESSFAPAQAAPVQVQFTPATTLAPSPRLESLKVSDLMAIGTRNGSQADGLINEAIERAKQQPMNPAQAKALFGLSPDVMSLAQLGQLFVASPDLGNAYLRVAMRGPAATPAPVTRTASTSGGGRTVPTALERLNGLVTHSLGGSQGKLLFGAPGSAREGQRSSTPPANADLSGSQAQDGKLTVWAYIKHLGQGTPTDPRVDTWINVGNYRVADLEEMATRDGNTARVALTIKAKAATGVPYSPDR